MTSPYAIISGRHGVRTIVIARVSQGTVSKWEAGEGSPDRNQLAFMRDEIKARGLAWDDRWFFEAPASPEPARVAS